MKQTRATLSVAALLLLPVLAAHACLAPFWHPSNLIRFPWVASVSLALTMLLIPAWLAIVACYVLIRRVPISILAGLALVATTLALNVFMSYANWGISTGRFWNPDNGTIMLAELAAIVGAVVIMIPIAVVLMIRNLSKPTPAREAKQ